MRLRGEEDLTRLYPQWLIICPDQQSFRLHFYSVDYGGKKSIFREWRQWKGHKKRRNDCSREDINNTSVLDSRPLPEDMCLVLSITWTLWDISVYFSLFTCIAKNKTKQIFLPNTLGGKDCKWVMVLKLKLFPEIHWKCQRAQGL